MKKIIRLTETDLHRIVRTSVDRVIKESSSLYDPEDDPGSDFMLNDPYYGEDNEEEEFVDGDYDEFGLGGGNPYEGIWDDPDAMDDEEIDFI